LLEAEGGTDKGRERKRRESTGPYLAHFHHLDIHLAQWGVLGGDARLRQEVIASRHAPKQVCGLEGENEKQEVKPSHK